MPGHFSSYANRREDSFFPPFFFVFGGEGREGWRRRERKFANVCGSFGYTTRYVLMKLETRSNEFRERSLGKSVFKLSLNVMKYPPGET